MEYILSSNYAGSGARVAISRFAADGTKASEVHAIISLPDQDSGEQPEAQIGRIARAADSLITELEPAGLRPIMARWLLSDAANLAPLLPGLTCGPVATSVIGQAPLNYTHCALWLYFMATDKVERIDDYSVAASRRGRSHIFTGSASISGLDSHKATTALLRDYNRLLTGRQSSLASGCVRTWFFVRDIDYFYKGMVTGRNEVFADLGLTPDTHFIASTGIEGNPGNPEVTVNMDAWAVSGLVDDQITYIKAPDYLNPTHEYGVAFERATAIDYADRRHLIISGTASIDYEGRIVSPGDICGQTRRMIENVNALLRNGKATWSDVAYIIIYLRDPAHRPAVDRLMEQQFPEACSAPRIIVEAPVCRPGWLIEMECMAIVPTSMPCYAPF